MMKKKTTIHIFLSHCMANIKNKCKLLRFVLYFKEKNHWKTYRYMLSFSLHQMKILNCSDRVVGAGSGADLKVWLRLHLKTSAPAGSWSGSGYGNPGILLLFIFEQNLKRIILLQTMCWKRSSTPERWRLRSVATLPQVFRLHTSPCLAES